MINGVSSSSIDSSTTNAFVEIPSEQRLISPSPITSHKTWKDQFYDVVKSNPYLHAGVGVYVLTILAIIGRLGMKVMSTSFKRRFIMSIEMTNRDPSYNWVMQWMSHHPTFHFQQMSVITANVTINANDQATEDCVFAPSPNVPHWLIHNRWPYMIFRKRQVERAAGSDVLEILEISALGRNKQALIDIVHDAKDRALAKDNDKTVIYQNAGGRWVRIQEPRMRRPLKSVVLPGNMRTELLADVRLFLQSKEYYRKLGVPYRRGYLLHGYPGNGKSSLVMALAGELRLAICLLFLSNRSLDDESLNNLLNTAPVHSIVLLEDIDRAFVNGSRVTMSGILNALDGVAAQEGRLVFMTTNHIERLDAALIRPGRADMIMEIGMSTREQAKELFENFFPNATERVKEKFAETMSESRVSVAQLQSHLFYYRDDEEGALNTLPVFLDAVADFESNVEKAREREEKRKQMQIPMPIPGGSF